MMFNYEPATVTINDLTPQIKINSLDAALLARATKSKTFIGSSAVNYNITRDEAAIGLSGELSTQETAYVLDNYRILGAAHFDASGGDGIIVAQRLSDNAVFIARSGTNSVKDALNDAGIAIYNNPYTSYIDNDAVLQILTKHSIPLTTDIYVTGHSLGGPAGLSILEYLEGKGYAVGGAYLFNSPGLGDLLSHPSTEINNNTYYFTLDNGIELVSGQGYRQGHEVFLHDNKSWTYDVLGHGISRLSAALWAGVKPTLSPAVQSAIDASFAATSISDVTSATNAIVQNNSWFQTKYVEGMELLDTFMSSQLISQGSQIPSDGSNYNLSYESLFDGHYVSVDVHRTVDGKFEGTVSYADRVDPATDQALSGGSFTRWSSSDGTDTGIEGLVFSERLSDGAYVPESSVKITYGETPNGRQPFKIDGSTYAYNSDGSYSRTDTQNYLGPVNLNPADPLIIDNSYNKISSSFQRTVDIDINGAETPRSLDDLLNYNKRNYYDINGKAVKNDGRQIVYQTQNDSAAVRTAAGIGSILGSTLGRQIVGSDPFAQIGASTVLGSLGQALGKAIGDSVKGVNASFSSSLKQSMDHLPSSIAGAGAGAISAYLVGELISEIGISGVPAQVLQTSAGYLVSSIATNLATQQAWDAGISWANLGNAAGAFVGAMLASRVVSFDTIGGQIGASVGAAAGGFAMAEWGAHIGITFGPLGAAIGAFVGYIAGGLIGSLFGGTPRSGADVTWDAAQGDFGVTNIWSKKSGSKEAAEGIASAAAGTYNGVLAEIGGNLLNPDSISAGSYGMRKKDYVYRQNGNDVYKSSNVSDVIDYGTYFGLQGMQIAGGDVYLKRALNSTLAQAGSAYGFDSSTLLGNLTTAQDYESYLQNSTAINALIASEPDSAFSAGWVITLARSVELNLNKRAASDWTGGFSTWLDQIADGKIDNQGLPVSNLTAYYDTQDNSRVWQATDGDGSYIGYIGDTISAADKDVITGTASADHIRVTGDTLAASGGGINTALTLNGAAFDGAAHVIAVAAKIDGGDGDDIIEGGDLGNDIFGGAGNDVLYGGKLDDWIFGGDGNDTLDAGSADSSAKGGDGNYMDGGAGNDTLYGREGSDWLEGGAGADTLYGNGGDDILAGGAGDGDALYGGDGADQYIYRLGDGADVAEDGAIGGVGAADSVATRIEQITAGTVAADWYGGDIYSENGVSVSGEDRLTFGAGIGLGDITLQRSGTTAAPGMDLIVKITGHAGDQITLTGWFDSTKRVEWLEFADGQAVRIGDFASFVVGTGGDDVIVGTDGNDFVVGGSGDDRLQLLGGDDVGIGGLGMDQIGGDDGRDILVGGNDDDRIMGGAGDDVLSGDGGNDDLNGGSGNDIISGGRGDDMLAGGVGDDIFRISRGDGHDTLVDDYAGTWDTVWTTAGGWNAAAGYTLDTGTNRVMKGSEVVFDGANWLGRYDFDYNTATSSGTLKRLIPAAGGQIGKDAATGDSDALEFALDINIQDLELSRQGNDLVLGISEENASVGDFTKLADQIRFKDWYVGNVPIEKFVFASTGILNMETTTAGGATGNVVTDGNDTLTGTGGADWITGNGGDDIITGGSGDDILNGNAGQDTLYGNDGNDVLYGGAGDDILMGGKGAADILIGGAGSDTASYAEDTSVDLRVYLANPEYNVGSYAVGDTYSGIENITGGNGHDRLAGDDNDNVINGGPGDDTMLGGLGDDTYIKGLNIGGGNSDSIKDGAFEIQEAVNAAGTLQDGYTTTWTSKGTTVVSGVTYYVFELTVTNSQSELVYDYASYNYTNPSQTMPSVSSWNTSGWKNGFGRSGNSQQITREVFDTTQNGGEDTLEFEAGTSLSDLWGYNSTNYFTLNTNIGDLRLYNQSDANLQIEWLQLADGLTVSLKSIKTSYGGSTVNGVDGVDDLILGNAGSQTLNGLGGNDALSGGAGNDTLYGGNGDDYLEGGAGADILDGGAGEDTIRYVRSTAGVAVDLSAMTASGGDAAGDTLTAVEHIVGSSDYGDTLTGSSGNNRLFGLGGNDTLTGNAGDDVLDGGDGDDMLYGDAGEDNITGGGGNDQAWGGDDNDLIAGGDGDDILHGDVGDDQLIAGSGDDTLYGDAGGDLLAGGDGNDTLYGGDGDDQLVGGTGNDNLQGGLGNDIYGFDAFSGNDQIIDADGANNIIAFDGSVDYSHVWLTRNGNDLRVGVIGGTTTITVKDYYATSGQSRISAIATTTHMIYLSSAEALISAMTSEQVNTPDSMPPSIADLADSSWHLGGKAVPVAQDTALTIDEDTPSLTQAVTYTDDDNNVTGFAVDYLPTHGTVTLDGITGQFSYAPDANYYGSDEFFINVTDADGNIATAKISVTINSVNDAPTDITLTPDEAYAGIPENTDNISIGALAVADVDDPEDGDYALHLLSVSDSRFEITSGNTLRLKAGSQFDYETTPTVTIDVTATDRNGAGLSVTKSFTLSILDLVDVINGTAAADTLIGAQGVDQIYGLDGNDILEGRAGNDMLDGGNGNDTLRGEAGNDVLYGQVGNDTLYGGDDNDTLYGGDGLDTLNGEAGNDTLYGGNENDTLSGGAGTNTLYGELGDDIFLGGSGADAFDGGAGSDTVSYAASTAAVTVNLAGGAGLEDAADDAYVSIENITGSAYADTLTGDANSNQILGGLGNDTLTGNDGADNLQGQAGNDSLTGGNGDDTLDGGDGDDIIYGGAGNDTLLGGAGADQLYAESGDDILDGGTGNDILNGGIDNDTYLIKTDSGQDTIQNYDPSGDDIDVMGYQNINDRDLWFAKSGDDMVISVIGTTTATTIANWYLISDATSRANYKIDFIIAGERFSKTIDVEGLVTLMAGKTMPATLAARDALMSGDATYNGAWEALWGNNAPPAVAAISDQTVNEDTALSITVRATDDLTPNAGLTLYVTPINPLTGQEDWSLIATGGITVGAGDSAGDHSLTINPKANASGIVNIKVQAVDAGGLTSERIFSLTINAQADMPTITQVTDASGTFVGSATIPLTIQVNFPDQDGSEVQEVVISGIPSGLSLNHGAFDSGLNAWVVAGAQLSGLALTGPAAWSQDFTLSVYARAREQSNDDTAQTSAQNLAVTVNAAPTDLTFTSSISEFTTNNAVVGTVGYSDPDDDTSVTFTMLDNAGGRFKMSGNQILVNNASLIDYEIATSHAVTVKVQDAGGLSYTEVLTIPVIDVNERPSFNSTTYTTSSVSEAASVNTIVSAGGVIAATDPDGSTFGVKQYYFVNANGTNIVSTDGTYKISSTSQDGLFTIDVNTGQVKLVGALNYEALPTGDKAYHYNILVKDGTTTPRSNIAALNIPVADANDAPVLTSQSFSVNEQPANPTLPIATVSFSDPDTLAANRNFFFSLSGTDSNYFTIDNLGQIKPVLDLNYEDVNHRSFGLTVDLWDQGNGTGNHVSAPITINLQNVNEIPEPNVTSLYGTGLTQLDASNYILASYSTGMFGIQYGIIIVTANDPDGATDPTFGGPFTYEVSHVATPTFLYVSDPFISEDGLSASINAKGKGTFQLRVIDNALGASQVLNFTVTYDGVAPPIVLDLDGDGIELVSSALSNVTFDMDGDGIKDPTGWAAADDGFLALDRNKDGVINDISEISFTADGDGSISDLEGLQSYDSNGNGLLDAGDDRFAEFLVWQDANQNGVSDAGELKSLSDAGIASINLTLTTTGNVENTADNVIYANSEYTRTDGTTRAVGDVSMSYFPSANSANPRLDTIGLDLGNDGLTINNIPTSQTLFDMTSDGTLHRTAWVGADDAFLAIDLNGDGLITNGLEISFSHNSGDASALKSYDSNDDGVLDEADARFGDFRVWQDANQDGVSQTTELKTLSDAGIASINIPMTLTGNVASGYADSVIQSTTSFTRADGTTGGASTVLLSYNQNAVATPITFDLGDDGLNTISLAQSSVSFDMNGDGVNEKTGWAGAGDGMLALDRNHDGKIEGISEISFAQDLPGAKTDLEGLAAFDSNHDGLLTALDSSFGDFQVWQDKNQNGISEAGELTSLLDAGIAGINLKATPQQPNAGAGENILFNTANFIRADGSTGILGDFGFAYDAGHTLQKPSNIATLVSSDATHPVSDDTAHHFAEAIYNMMKAGPDNDNTDSPAAKSDIALGSNILADINGANINGQLDQLVQAMAVFSPQGAFAALDRSLGSDAQAHNLYASSLHTELRNIG